MCILLVDNFKHPGGARITHALAKELGYDAGFGAGTYADDVATFCSKELVRRLGK